MRNFRKRYAFESLAVAFLAFAFALVCAFGRKNAVAADSADQPQGEAPAASQPSPEAQNIMRQIANDAAQLNEIQGDQPMLLYMPALRKKVEAREVPLLRDMDQMLSKLFDLQPSLIARFSETEVRDLAALSVFGDKPAVDKLQNMEQSNDPSEALRGKAGQLLARWYGAGRSEDAESKVIDDLELLDKAHPTSESLTNLTFACGDMAAMPALKTRLYRIIIDNMSNRVADRLTPLLQAMFIDEGKPLTIVGATIDGRHFTTAGWKGKVILVVFFATWSADSRQEEPALKKMFDDLNSKGLEIVGISNDYEPDPLKAFIAENAIPWPVLFDPGAAAKKQYHPFAAPLGLQHLPTMFLIDKSGILRSESAEQNTQQQIEALLTD